MDCNPPGSSVRGISQTRILEWVAISLSKGSSQPRDQTSVSYIASGLFTTEPLFHPCSDTVDFLCRLDLFCYCLGFLYIAHYLSIDDHSVLSLSFLPAIPLGGCIKICIFSPLLLLRVNFLVFFFFLLL